jgi:hypothetical protein
VVQAGRFDVNAEVPHGCLRKRKRAGESPALTVLIGGNARSLDIERHVHPDTVLLLPGRHRGGRLLRGHHRRPNARPFGVGVVDFTRPLPDPGMLSRHFVQFPVFINVLYQAQKFLL